jgi:TonB family protein
MSSKRQTWFITAIIVGCLNLLGCASNRPVLTGQAAIDDFNQQMQLAINKVKRYPREAAQAHVEGTVQVSFDYGDDGIARNIRVDKSSGNAYLDRAAQLAIAYARIPPKPVEMQSVTHFVFIETFDIPHHR